MSEENNKQESTTYLLAVYGTLKENFPNYYYYLNPLVPIFRGAVIVHYKMYSNGGFPLLFKSEELTKIYVEIFEVSDAILKKIDRLEGVPDLYSRISIWLEEVKSEVFLYVITNKEPTGELIDDGIFRRNKEEK